MNIKLTAMAAAAALLLATGCKKSTTQQTDVISNFVIDETIKTASMSFCADDTATTPATKIYAQLSTSVQWIEKLGDNNIRPLQDTIQARMYGAATLGKGIDRAIMSYLDASQAFGVPDLRFNAVDSVPPALDPGSNWSIDISGRIVDLNEHFVSYQITTETFTGGAHGSHSTSPFTYALAEGTVLNYDNMFKPGTQQQVLALVDEQLAQDLNVSVNKLSEGGLFNDNLTVMGTPYVDNYYIVFFYNEYEIAPYSMGPIEVRVPAWTLSDYLTPLAHRLTLDD